MISIRWGAERGALLGVIAVGGIVLFLRGVAVKFAIWVWVQCAATGSGMADFHRFGCTQICRK